MVNIFEKETAVEKIVPGLKRANPGGHIVEQAHMDALVGESYEDASAALDKLDALLAFRNSVSRLPFGGFHELVENISNVNKLTLSDEQKKMQIEALSEAAMDRSIGMSPRVADFFEAMLAEAQGISREPRFDITRGKIAELKQAGDLGVLFSEDAPWEMKLNRIEKRLLDYLKGARSLDRREGKEMDDDVREWRREELKKAPANPPERRNESRPGVDPMERLKEGERAPAIWSIQPAWGGYYKEQSFSKWDGARKVWTEDEYVYVEAEAVPLSGNKESKEGPIDIVLSAKVFAGRWITLPVPYTHDLHKIEAGGRACETKKDQNGDLVIFAGGHAGEEIELSVMLAPHPGKKFLPRELRDIHAPDMPSEFSEETERKLSEIASQKRGNIARARAVKRYVCSRVQYLAPKDQSEAEYFNDLYRNSPKGFAGAVDEVKKADCDVANTYFAALCARIGIPVRHCVGHSVKGRDEKGFSNINSGTGHGWSEVWDEAGKEWARMDATPPGDPNLDEQDQAEGDNIPGDFGEPEAVRPTDEQLEELRRKLLEHKEKLSYTKEERRLAEAAGVELREARQIVKEINEAEKTRLPSGELVVDALSRLFNAIVESRKSVAVAYDGPVRRREGGEGIEDIVRHRVGISARDADPMSREKPVEETKEEKTIGGFDLYLIGDKSGSMQSSVEGERLWQMQRRAEYLIFSSLHRFEKNLERAGLQKKDALSVRTQGISFRGSGSDDIDLDKPLSGNFTAGDKVKLWRSLTEQGTGNGDVAALSYIFEQIEAEIQEVEKRGGRNNRLRMIIACSDGGPDSPTGVRELAQKLGRLSAVVVGVGLTETAAAVPVIYNTPFSRGDIARDINDLPVIVAKHLVMEAIKLFPEKTKDSVKGIIESAIQKFKNI